MRLVPRVLRSLYCGFVFNLTYGCLYDDCLVHGGKHRWCEEET